jgi:predicted enzyme related to lactoylglutathione lyase
MFECQVSAMARGVVHFEIPADDEVRAGKFYSSAFGWEVNPVPELSYTMIKTTPTDESGMPSVPGSINGGMFRREGTVTSPVVTVDVDDIDAALAKIEELGGSTVTPRQEVGAMGWAAYFKDTEGNIVGLWQNAAPEGSPSDAAGTGAAAGGNDIGA